MAVIVFGLVRLLCLLHPPEIYDAGDRVGYPCIVEGRVSDRYYKNDSLVVQIQKVRIISNPTDDKKSQNKTEYLRGALCYTDIPISDNNLPCIGQALRIRGKLYSFERSRNPGQFDMAFYRAIHGIDIALMDAKIEEKGKYYKYFPEVLKQIRERTAVLYDTCLSEEDAGVIKAMLLGEKTSLDSDIKDIYKRAGISHILSISALHVSIIGLGFYRLLLRFKLKRIIAVILSFFIILSYAEMTGGSASVVRASIMLGTCITAELIGRSYDLLSAMSFSMIIILLLQPMLCMDAGFLLSFGAVTGIALMGNIKVPKAFSAAFMSLSVTVFTFPIVLYFFYQIPIFSVFLNLIIVPLMTVLMIAAILLAFCSWTGLPFVFMPAGICHLILMIYKITSSFFARADGCVLVAGRPAIWRIVIYYMILLSFLFIKDRIEDKKKKRRLMAVGILLMMGIIFFNPNTRFRYMMLDIGQGDCNFIRSPSGITYMIDCGSTDEKEIAKYKVVPALKSMGVSKINMAFMTHSDADHINGFIELLEMENGEGLRIETLVLPDIAEPDEAYTKLAELARKKGTELRIIKKGDRFNDGEMTVECLNPAEKAVTEDANSYSTVLSVRYRDFSLLLTGDVQGENEKALVNSLKGSYTILKVAHHGSRNSSPEEVLDIIKPRYAFISCGRKNKYGHPHSETIEKLEERRADIYITKDVGAITAETDGKHMKIYEYIRSI